MQLLTGCCACVLVLAVQVGVLGLSLYNVTTNLLRLKAWYALFVYGLVPLGVIFFSFAAGCAIKGIFSLIFGKQHRHTHNCLAVGPTPVAHHHRSCPKRPVHAGKKCTARASYGHVMSIRQASCKVQRTYSRCAVL